MVRIVHGMKSPQMVQNVYGTKSLVPRLRRRSMGLFKDNDVYCSRTLEADCYFYWFSLVWCVRFELFAVNVDCYFVSLLD